MRITIVGNGPSSAKCKPDASEFIVRCSWWKSHPHMQACGDYMNAWAWFGNDCPPACTGGTPVGDYQIWNTYPACLLGNNLKQLGNEPIGNLVQLAASAGGHPVVTVRPALWFMLSDALGGYRPTNGLVAVAMALERVPEVLTLYGFDMSGGGWHDFKKEKALLSRLADEQYFFGPSTTRLNWVARP